MNERDLADTCTKVDRRSPEPKDPTHCLHAPDSEVRRAIERAGKRMPAHL